MPSKGSFSLRVDPTESGMRLDAYLSSHLDACSRSRASDLIRQGNVLVDGCRRKTGYKVKSDERITGTVPAPASLDLAAEPIPLDVLFEDRHLLVLNKPAGIVVHPSAGHPNGTLVNGLLYHCPDLDGIGAEKRPGIVHRLDKDTTGVLVVAKNDDAHQHLSGQFKARRVNKEYLALVAGVPAQSEGLIELPLGRHRQERKKMAVVGYGGREAVTLWRTKERFSGAALLTVTLRTGRTHQIRVHCLSLGHPILGDPVYGRRRSVLRLARTVPGLYDIVHPLKRQMLHARRLEFTHPIDGERLVFEAELPEDMQSTLDALRSLNEHRS